MKFDIHMNLLFLGKFILILKLLQVNASDSKLIIPTSLNILPDNCKQNCTSTFGEILGSHSNVVALSNCNNECVNYNEEQFLNENQTDLHGNIYTGIKWQCVEYSRRYLILIEKVTFHSIDSAFNIFDLKNLTQLLTKSEYNEGKTPSYYDFESFTNGNSEHPRKGDLIIFPKANDAPDGHVAVCTGVNIEKKYIEITEQNYYNKKWESESYSRRLILKKEGELFYLLDKEWVKDIELNFLFEECLNVNTCKDVKISKLSVIGWKRKGKTIN